MRKHLNLKLVYSHKAKQDTIYIRIWNQYRFKHIPFIMFKRYKSTYNNVIIDCDPITIHDPIQQLFKLTNNQMNDMMIAKCQSRIYKDQYSPEAINHYSHKNKKHLENRKKR